METTDFLRTPWPSERCRFPSLLIGSSRKRAHVQLVVERNLLWHSPKTLVWYYIETAISYRISTGWFSVLITHENFESTQTHHSKLSVRNVAWIKQAYPGESYSSKATCNFSRLRKRHIQVQHLFDFTKLLSLPNILLYIHLSKDGAMLRIRVRNVSFSKRVARYPALTALLKMKNTFLMPYCE